MVATGAHFLGGWVVVRRGHAWSVRRLFFPAFAPPKKKCVETRAKPPTMRCFSPAHTAQR